MVKALPYPLPLTFSAYTCPTFNYQLPHLHEGFLWLPVPTELILEGGSLGMSIKPYPTCSQGWILRWINAPAPGWDNSKARALHWLWVPPEDSSYRIVIIYHLLCLFSLPYLTFLTFLFPQLSNKPQTRETLSQFAQTKCPLSIQISTFRVFCCL